MLEAQLKMKLALSQKKFGAPKLEADYGNKLLMHIALGCSKHLYKCKRCRRL